MKVFLDTNVIIDVLAAREPFFRDSQRVVDYCDKSGFGGVGISVCTPTEFVGKYIS